MVAMSSEGPAGPGGVLRGELVGVAGLWEGRSAAESPRGVAG